MVGVEAWFAIAAAVSRAPPFSRYAVIPPSPETYGFPIFVPVSAARARQRVIR